MTGSTVERRDALAATRPPRRLPRCRTHRALPPGPLGSVAATRGGACSTKNIQMTRNARSARGSGLDLGPALSGQSLSTELRG